MMSAYESIDLVEQCILSGADAYLLKPLRVHELRNIWQYAWRRRHELVLQQQLSLLMPSGRHGAATPDLGQATRVKGCRQRLTKELVPELQDATRQLDKLELVTTRAADRQLRDELRALVLEETRTAPPSSQHGPSRNSRSLPPLTTLAEGPDITSESAQTESPKDTDRSSTHDPPRNAAEARAALDDGGGDGAVGVGGMTVASRAAAASDCGPTCEHSMELPASSHAPNEVGGTELPTAHPSGGECIHSPLSDGCGGGRGGDGGGEGAQHHDLPPRGTMSPAPERDGGGGGGSCAGSGSLLRGEKDRERTAICKLCEQRVCVDDLAYHLVHCTAAHSCQEKLRQLDHALRRISSRIRRGQVRISQVFRRMEEALQPLEAVSAFSEAAADPTTSAHAPPHPSNHPVVPSSGTAEAVAGLNEADDPMRQTYRLMELQRLADAKLANLPDPSLADLAAQASRLVSQKIHVLWDLLSLHDPLALVGQQQQPTAKPRAISMREYALVEPLGTGGFGTVWLARRKRTGDLSAIKVLSRADTVARNMLSSVRLEKSILASADCPFVVQLYFSFATAKHLYMVMEYLPGGDCLTQLRTFGFLEVDYARWFVAEALLGLQYLHQASIIHRDVKPSNMLITATGHIKLADFGLSAAAAGGVSGASTDDGARDGAHRETVVATAVGTPDYLSPELLEQGGYSYEADFWAIGVVLYQFLVGETPFAADSLQKTFARILRLDCYFPSADDVCADAADLLPQLLVLEPARRLGGSGGAAAAILAHAFFASLSLEEGPPLWQARSGLTQIFLIVGCCSRTFSTVHMSPFLGACCGFLAWHLPL